MMHWQAITNNTSTIGTRAALVSDNNNTSAQPITPAIRLWPANPERRMLANFVQVAVSISASLRAIVAGASTTKLPRLALKRRAAVLAYKLYSRNPLVVGFAASDWWLSVTLWRWSLGIHSSNHSAPTTLPGTVPPAPVLYLTGQHSTLFVADLTANSDPINWSTHKCFLLVSIIPQFGGSGTVGRVAARYQRDAVLIELSSEYIDSHIDKRTDGLQVEMFV